MATVNLTIRRGGIDGHSYALEMDELAPSGGATPLASITYGPEVPLSLGCELREADGTRWTVVYGQNSPTPGLRECVAVRLS